MNSIYSLNFSYSRVPNIIGRVEIIGGLDIVIIINNRGTWNNRGRGDGRG